MPRRTVRSRRSGLLVPVIGFAVVAYFAWHGFHGAYGFWSARALETRIAELTVELAELRRERETLEQRVSLLRPESLDPDMLEERAMALLNHAPPNDVVIMRRPPAAMDLPN
jgi:cell division protein FtsB